MDEPKGPRQSKPANAPKKGNVGSKIGKTDKETEMHVDEVVKSALNPEVEKEVARENHTDPEPEFRSMGIMTMARVMEIKKMRQISMMMSQAVLSSVTRLLKMMSQFHQLRIMRVHKTRGVKGRIFLWRRSIILKFLFLRTQTIWIMSLRLS